MSNNLHRITQEEFEPEVDPKVDLTMAYPNLSEEEEEENRLCVWEHFHVVQKIKEDDKESAQLAFSLHMQEVKELMNSFNKN